MKLLVTGAGGPAGSSLIRQLTDRGLPVVGVDMRPVSESTAQATYVVPPATDPAMLVELRRIIRADGLSTLIPTVSEELPQIAAARAAFDDTRVVVAGPGPVSIANDKLFTAWHLQARGISVPPFGACEEFVDAAAAFEWLGGPLVVKPRVSRGGRDVIVVDRPEDIDWSQVPSYSLVQRFAPGTEYSPVVYRPEPGSAARAIVTVLEKTGLAAGRVGNATQVRRLPDGQEPDVARLAVAAVRALGLVGPVDLDIRRAEDGTPQVLEVNARFGANSAAVPELVDEMLVGAGYSGARSAS
ncbi:ATP-grasp domain-containing protein [Flexivirga meconopsidis]|uniref:ATP-grasp domain-containing protein n=1 Tax=Flexivirga meconopsidis TaxID=2977121 RepID=UPI00223F6060|nr:ATP-grasp domain-containing protein [Flexivirga meconopsidis]